MGKAQRIDTARFLDLATREQMLPPGSARELAKQIKRSGKPPGPFLLDSGQMTAIQVEAIEGLLRPDSVAEGYEVVGLLGHGGIGIVYKARQPTLDRVVALKTISTTRVRAAKGGKGSSALARFQQEAVAIAKLKHPNIVAAYDYGSGDDRLYLAMEMVDGIDLESHIKKAKRLDEATAWRMASQVASALAHAYEFGIIHRDIKPANLLLTRPPAGYPLPEGTPLLKVTDFGLARLNAGQQGEEQTRLTMTGATMGTPHYMAPEQIDDSQVGLQADVYALGATVYHMIVGEPPLAGLSLMKIFAAKLAGDSSSLDELPSDISEPTRGLLADMLRFKPEDRPQTYTELLERIGQVLGDDQLRTTVSVGSSTPAPLSFDPTTEPSGSLLPVRRKRAAWLTTLLGVVGVAVLGVVFATAIQGSPPTPRHRLSSAPGDSDEWWPVINTAAIPVELQGFRAYAPDRDEIDHAGYLKVNGSGTWALKLEDRQPFPEPDHFGVFFRVQLDGGPDAALEVRFDTQADGAHNVLRIDNAGATLGVKAGDATGFTATHEPAAIFFDPEADIGGSPSFQIDRDERYWFVYHNQIGEAAPRLIGWARRSEQPPEKIRFTEMGGDAWVGDLHLVALVPVGESDPSDDRPGAGG